MTEASQHRAILALIAGLAIIKTLIAARLGLFVDEAAYWQAGRHLAWGYSELPGLSAWMTALGEAAIGHSYLGVRSVFLVLGTLLPAAVWLLARELLDARRAWLAALLTLALPLGATQGVLAAPDAILNIVVVLFFWSWLRALERPRWWWVAGMLVAVGLLAHWRMAVPLFAVILWSVLTTRGRRTLRTPGPWIAAALGAVGLIPTLLFNLGHAFASFRFQVVERHPWAFNPDGLQQPLEQALVTTPGMYLLLLGAGIGLARRSIRAGADDRWQLVAWAGLLPVVFYFVAGLFADTKLVTFHWPLVGYLVLLVPLADWLDSLWYKAGKLARGLAALAVGLGLVGSAAGVAVLAVVASSSVDHPLQDLWAAEELVGWDRAAARVEALRKPADEVLIADNHNLGSELAFELDLPGRAHPFVLNHPRNVRYGRAVQSVIWGRDQRSLFESRWSRGLLVAELSASKFAERPALVRSWCELFGEMELLDELVLLGGRKRFLFFRVRPPHKGAGCDLPAFAYLDEPARDARVSGDVEISGWAFEDDQGVAAVEILLDGTPIGMAEYGLPYPGVRALFSGSTDPQHPDVGFRMTWDSRTAPPGRHVLAVRTIAHDGGRRVAVEQPVRVAEQAPVVSP